MKYCIAFFCIIFLSFSCQNIDKYSSKDLSLNELNSEHPGKHLMEINCYVCHNPTASHDERVGPPMIAIKKHYLKEGMSKEAFINDIQNWIDNPTEENAKMFGAVNRFGVMPKQNFPKETITLIADYIYSNEIEQPDWFEDYYKSKQGKNKGQGKHHGHGKGKKKKL